MKETGIDSISFFAKYIYFTVYIYIYIYSIFLIKAILAETSVVVAIDLRQ